VNAIIAAFAIGAVSGFALGVGGETPPASPAVHGSAPVRAPAEVQQ